MQFRDLGKQRERLAESLDAAILKAAASCRFIMGPEVRQLESELAEYVGVKHVLTCANGTDALALCVAKTAGNYKRRPQKGLCRYYRRHSQAHF